MKRFHFSILEKKVDRRLNVKGKDLTPKMTPKFDPKDDPKEEKPAR